MSAAHEGAPAHYAPFCPPFAPFCPLLPRLAAPCNSTVTQDLLDSKFARANQRNIGPYYRNVASLP
jgi:hypothetical protein